MAAKRAAVLLVRMSSLGDIVHTFPAVTDLKRERPDLRLDWLVKDRYVDLARMHPGVDVVLPRSAGLAGMRASRYAAVVDAQGLIKSALIARLAHGPLHGFAWDTAREPLASLLYDHKVGFAQSDHKIFRYRELLAAALGYAAGTTIDYGLRAPVAPEWAPREAYAVLLHSTARAGKLWAEAAWIEVGRVLEARGLTCVLPFGDAAEEARARRLVASLARARVAPKMTIVEAAGLLARARVVIGLDTGLMHLSAALRTPVVGVFCDSEPVDAHPVGQGRTAYCGGIGRPPAVSEVLAAFEQVTAA